MTPAQDESTECLLECLKTGWRLDIVSQYFLLPGVAFELVLHHLLVFPVWENRVSRAGKNAFIPPNNYLDWDGIASLFKSNSRGWAPNNTYYMPSSPPSTCDLYWGCFLQLPFSYEKL